MTVPTTISPGPRPTELDGLTEAIESHPIWTELRGPDTINNTDPTGHSILGDVLGGIFAAAAVVAVGAALATGIGEELLLFGAAGVASAGPPAVGLTAASYFTITDS